ncbi:MAG TPA: VOC family protein [Candidatus Acidoferrales bacterium]|nr:VOC family protein [Candidatus Acidoferrales bacterium]
MAKLGEVVIVANSPQRLSAFYRQVFELTPIAESAAHVVLSDGYVNLVLRKDSRLAPGLHAARFHVENAAALRHKLGANAQDQIADPDGNLIEVDEKEFVTAKKATPFPIRHLALYTPDPRRLASFYENNLQLREVAATDRSSIFVSDGYFNLALLFERPGEEKLGLNHFGFHVKDIEEMRDRAEKAGMPRGDKRPDRIPFAEYRLHDPEGNGIDISVKGWKA